MKVISRNDLSKLKKDDHVVLFIDDKTKSNDAAISVMRGGDLFKEADLSSFKASASDILYFNSKDKPGVILCGLGDLSKLNDEVLRNCAAAAVKFFI